MRKGSMVFVLLITLALALTACGNQSTEADPASEQNDLATEFVTQLVDGNYSDAAANFNDEMKSALPEEQLKATWEQVEAQVGAYKNEVGRRTEIADGYGIVIVTAEFENAKIDIRVAFDDNNKIAGLFFQPAQ